MGFENLNRTNHEKKAVFAEVINTWGDQKTEIFIKRRLNDSKLALDGGLSSKYEKLIIQRLLDGKQVVPETFLAELKMNDLEEGVDVDEFNKACELVFDYLSTENNQNINSVINDYTDESMILKFGEINENNVHLYRDNAIPVKVQRSSIGDEIGVIEEGWFIDSYNDTNNIVTLTKDGMRKNINLSKLIEVNS